MKSFRPMAKTIVVVLAMTALEVAWALFCAIELPQTDTYLVVFYAVLVAASAVFFLPVVAAPRNAAGETNR